MKTQVLCKDFLQSYKKGALLDPIQAAQAMNDIWGIRVDWHEMSAALDELTRYELASEHGRGADGMTLYLVE